MKELMGELIRELEQGETVSADTVEIARRLEADIHDLVDPEVASEENTILDDAIALEARFAATHPVAERLLRELINSLSRIGI